MVFLPTNSRNIHSEFLLAWSEWCYNGFDHNFLVLSSIYLGQALGDPDSYFIKGREEIYGGPHELEEEMDEIGSPLMIRVNRDSFVALVLESNGSSKDKWKGYGG